MAARRGIPPLPNRSSDTEMWPTGFAYYVDIALPPPPPPTRSLSYAAVVTNCCQGLRWNVLPPGNAV